MRNGVELRNMIGATPEHCSRLDFNLGLEHSNPVLASIVALTSEISTFSAEENSIVVILERCRNDFCGNSGLFTAPCDIFRRIQREQILCAKLEILPSFSSLSPWVAWEPLSMVSCVNACGSTFMPSPDFFKT